MEKFRLAIQALLRLSVSALSIDLLYLYYAGGWCEPIAVIRITELIILFSLSIIGLVWAASHIIKGCE